MPNNLTLRIGGDTASTTGVITTGEVLTEALARSRYAVHTFRTNPAEIKGGQAIYQIRMGNTDVLSQGVLLDVLLAYDEEAINLHSKDMKPDGLLLFDAASFSKGSPPRAGALGVPFLALAQGGEKRSKNLVASGILARYLGLSLELLKDVVRKKFERSPVPVIESNLRAFEAGWNWAVENGSGKDLSVSPDPSRSHQLVMSGNEALAIGAIFAGCRFFAGYPITPASEILEFLQIELPKFGGYAIQTEDEMSAICSCIGASFAGIKAMTATSGPGLSLMAESIGLASMTELPIVVVNSQRAGPSTGMPTKTEQSDLFLALYGSHGEAPRAVIAPSDVRDCFYGIIQAFNVAEKYQIPVLVLADQSLSYRSQTFPRPDLEKIELVQREKVIPSAGGAGYQRYRLTENGVSPMSIPGESDATYVATGLEHDSFGAPNSSPENHFRMTAKRHKKLEFLSREKGFTRRFGAERAKVGVLSWGSTEGPIAAAVRDAGRQGIPVAALQVKMVHPLPDEEIRAFLNSVDKVILPELNFTGQFAQLIRGRYLKPVIPLNKCAGVPFNPAEILNKIQEVYSER